MMMIMMVNIVIGSRALSFSDPYKHFACLSVRHSVCLSATSELNISETRPDSGMVTMDGPYKLAYGLSIGHTPDDVTWPDDVIMMTSSFFFKMLLLRQFLSELDDIWTQCSPIWCVYMVLTDSRSGSYDVNDDVITYDHCRKLGLNISETRPDSGMVSTYSE